MSPHGINGRGDWRRRAIACVAVFLTIVMIGALSCLGDGHSRPTCPGGPGTCPTLASLWPSEDGTAWTYAYAEEAWTPPPAVVYPDRESVPPAPPLDEAYATMLRVLAEHPDSSTEAIYRLQFRGRITTHSGAEGQDLVGEFYQPDRTAPVVPASFAPASFPAVRSGDPFLARLAVVRPDLRGRIDQVTGRPPKAARRPSFNPRTLFAPFFLQGSCWTRLADRIGGYGDLDRELAWVYLTSDLAPGSTFRHQLVPALASDVFLHGRITQRQDVTTGAGTYRNCIECFYLVDYGITVYTDESGQPLGFGRGVDVGTIIYAPGAGPVQSLEYRDLAAPGESGFGLAAAIRLDLIGRSAP